MHLIVTRADLGTFDHLHPEPTGRAGEYAVEATFPTAGTFTLHTEVRREGEMADILDSDTVEVGGAPASRSVVPAQDVRTFRGHGTRIELEGDARLGGQSDFTLRFDHVDTSGRETSEVTDLRPYLGAAGHVVVMRSDGSTFGHRHAETFDGDGRPVLALPGSTFGPELDLHVRFERPGAYRLWAQVELGDGTVVTAPFVVHVAA